MTREGARLFAEPLSDEISTRPLPGPPPAFAVRALLGVRHALLSLADAVVPADVAVWDQAIGSVRTHLLGAVARYRFADLLDAHGPQTAGELAGRAGTHAASTERALRALVALRVFRRASDGRFANNRLSRALLTGRRSRGRDWLEYFASRSNSAAWADVAGTLKTGESAFERVHGTTIWDWFEQNPDERETFAHTMMGITTAQAPVVASLYPFGNVSRVCDVGGGRGTLLSELLVRHRHLSGVLCDAAGVLESARELLERRGVAGRALCVPTNFFESVPTGCDAYVLKNVLHDWDDERCLAILRTVRRAMRPGDRLVVAESLVGGGNATMPALISDVHMMVVCSGGAERGREEIVSLLARSGFRAGMAAEHPIIGIVEGVAAS